MHTDATDSRGLCLTCNRSAGCSLRGQAETAVWHCEEFDDRMAVIDSLPAAMVVATVDPLAGRPKPAGICSNCECLPTCRFTKPEGGVWRCEEYR